MKSIPGKTRSDLAPKKRSPSQWQPSWAKVALMLSLLFLAIALALWQLVPPNLIPASAPATEFSAERAMQQLQAIAQQPRPMGSAAHAAVREYLVRELQSMGLQPQVQTATIVQSGEGGWGAGTVNNVLVRIPGTASTGAIAIDAHYDAAETGPGASDCGACVVTALETVRALQAGAPLKNDAIVVFADGEEYGMLGARAFATEHPWMKDVKLAFNFEASGSRGTSVMYITSPNNWRLISEFVKAVPYPRMTSFSPAFWSFFPGAQIGCDLDEYTAKGSAGLGFYYAGDIPAYHTQRDSIAEIDPRSLQHNGSYTLAGLRHFGNLDLNLLASDRNAIYFNVIPNLVFLYPETQAIPLAIVTAILFIAVLYFGLRSRQLTLRGLVWGAIAFFLTAIGAVIVDILLWWAIQTLNPALQVFLIGNYAMNLYQAGFIVLTLGLMSAVYAGLRRRVELANLALGALSIGAILAIATSILMPGASYLLTLPLLANLCVWGWIFLRERALAFNWKTTVLLSIAAIPGIILLLPIQVYYFYSWMARFEGLVNLQAGMNIPLSALSMVFTALLFGLLIPHFVLLREAVRSESPFFAAFLTLIAFLLLGLATVNSGFSAEQPRPNSIAYFLDGDRGQASWVSRDRHLDAWTSQFFGAQPKRQTVELGLFPASSGYSASAPLVNLPALKVQRLELDDRTVRLQVKSPRKAAIAQIDLTAEGAIVDAKLNGKPLDLSQEQRNLKLLYFGLPPQGIELQLQFLEQSEPIKMTLTDYSLGLPDIPSQEIFPRPVGMMPAPAHPDYAIVRKSLNLVW